MTMSDFEDPTELSRCARSDCGRYRLNKDTPLCVQHMREQEMSAAGYVEPELEAKVARVRTEDDDHPGMAKVYDKETGEPSWVPAEESDPRLARPVPPPEQYVGPDPDVNGIDYDKVRAAEVLRLDVPTWNQRAGIDPRPERPQSDSGVWVAATTTRVMIFDNELDALRYAVANQAKAEFVPFNTELQLPR